MTEYRCRFERPPITEPKVWWHKMAVKRKDVYRRLALEHVGAESVISEHTIVRAHDRSYPLLIKMFFSNNYGARNFAATDTKVTKFTRILRYRAALKELGLSWRVDLRFSSDRNLITNPV
jgi:hypothetical protein